MAYLHEAALKKAVQKLYLLGSSDAPKRKRGNDFVDSMGSFVGMGIDQNAHNKIKAEQALKARQKLALDRRDAMVENNENWQVLKEKYGDQHANTYGAGISDFAHQPTPDFDGMPEAFDFKPESPVDRIQSNEVAAETRMGGKYTPAGLELADKNATLNAQDRIRMKSMIGSNMTMPTGMVGIGGSQRGY